MGRSVIIFGSILKSNFWRVYDVFLDLVILVYFNAIFVDLYAIRCFICIFFVFSMFISGRMHIKDLLYTPRILMNFFYCIYFGEGRVGGVNNACVCMRTHSLSYRTDWWMLTKLGRDEVFMALLMRLGFSAKSAQRWIQVGVMLVVCA